jgi:hypothetical protein
MSGRRGRSAASGKVARAIVLTLGGLTVILGVWYLIEKHPLVRPTRVVVRNATPHALPIVEAVLDYAGGGTTTERIGDLGPGQEHRFGPAANDFRIRLFFVLNGREYVHHDTVDLWRGETYVFHIQPDGTVLSGHDQGDEPEK